MGRLGAEQRFNKGRDTIDGMQKDPSFDHPLRFFNFKVPDIDEAVTRIAGAGGQILNRPHQVLVGGLMIQASDPQVAMFALVGPRKP
jgi:predicted enzyme related to lactoylglutathione lyase